MTRDGSLVWALPSDGCKSFDLYFGPTSPSVKTPVNGPAIQIPDYAADAYGKGWDFDRDDFEAIDVWGDRPANIRSRTVEDGILKLDVTGDSYFIWGDMWNTPQHSRRPVSIDLNRYPVLEMRIRQSVPDAEWGLYGRLGRGESLLHYGFRVSGTDWRTVRIDLRRQARWHGVLTAFRIDPTKYVNAHVELDWIRLLSLVEADRGPVEVLARSRGTLQTAIRLSDPRPRAGAEQTVMVTVRDSTGSAVPGQPVRLSLAAGTGAILPAAGRSGLPAPDGVRALTDAKGEAAFLYRASKRAGQAADRLVATAEFVASAPARLAVTTTPGPPAKYVVTPDHPVVLRPGEPPLKVTARLADSLGNPLPGRRTLAWSVPGARVLRADSRTAADGSGVAVLRVDPARSWVTQVSVRDSAGLSGESAQICVLPQGPRRNPVRLTKSGYFEAGGRPWMPLGGFYANWVGAPTPDGEWRRLISFTDATDDQIRAWLRFLTQNGVTAERFMLRTHRADGMEPMDIGGRVNPGLFAAFLHYLDLARPFGVRFLLVLHEDYTKPLYYDAHALERYALPWYAGRNLDHLPPYQRRFIRDRRLIDDIGDKYTDPDVIACQDRYAREIVGLLKGNPLVFAYELENEMVGCPASWVNHMAATIRSVDLTVPICVSHGGGGLFTADPAWWSANTTIDFYTPHLYPDVPVTSPDCDYGLAVDVLMRYVRRGKPAFLGESSGDQFSGHPDRDVRRWTMRDIIWFSLVDGAPGCFFWNARGSEVAEFKLASEIARRIDWTQFRRRPAGLIVEVPHELPSDQWFRAGPGGLAYAEMAKYDRFCLDRGADYDFALTTGGSIPEMRPPLMLNGMRFAPPDNLPSDFGITPGFQLAPLVRADDREALLYVRNVAGVVRWDSPGDHQSTQYLRTRAATALKIAVRLPGQYTADVWDLDTGAHQQRMLAPGQALDLGTTDHDFAVHLKRDEPRMLPAGYLGTRGSQIVGPDGRPVRIASVGLTGMNVVGGRLELEEPFKGIDSHVAAMKSFGFNCVRVDWIDKTLDDPGAMKQLDDFVTACGKVGLKVIFDNHNNEATSKDWENAAQQKNGLWFDTGPGTDGTDGAGNQGTISAARFREDWVRFARHWTGNPTVIGFDIRNEPCAHWKKSPPVWGGGGPTDIHAMYESVGNAILGVNPDALIICEAVINYQTDSYEGDLSPARKLPIRLRNPRKLVYSVHEYPKEIGGYKGPESGPGYVERMNRTWGWLVKENVAPVWIGEMGASMLSDSSKEWGRTLLDYMNGRAPGGPTFSGDQQPIGGDWWAWGHLEGQNPNGCVAADGRVRPEQAPFVDAMLFRRNL